jgi:hypothetical protein
VLALQSTGAEGGDGIKQLLPVGYRTPFSLPFSERQMETNRPRFWGYFLRGVLGIFPIYL